jgi:hypothetical protein
MVSELNKSQTIQPSIGNRMASVIRASKGPVKPVLINKGDTQRLISIFGNQSASYPDVWDVSEAIKISDCWISAPTKSGLYGGVMVTKTGTEPLVSGYTSLSALSFAALPVSEVLGTGDGSTAAFSIVLTNATYYNIQTIGIKVNGVTINVSATNAATEVLTTTPNVGSGTYVRSSGILTFTFSSAPALGSAITAFYTENRAADVYYILFNCNPEVDDTGVQVTMTNSVFTINAYSKDPSTLAYTSLPLSPYSVSLTSGTKDGFGKNIYINDVFLSPGAEDDYFYPVVNTALTLSTFTNDTSVVDLAGGSRGSAITITELTTGWAYFQQARNYAADIFFDCTADAGIPVLFSTLRNTYQKYKAYLLPLPNTVASVAITNKSALSISDRGIYFYWNWGKAKDSINNSYLYSPLMGRVAGKHAAMVDVFNGLAPSWIDENGHGGQLGSGIIEMVTDPSESDLELLDTAQINPIIFDPQYGVMIVSDRTSLTTLSDYSYIPHSRVADYCISNIVTNALPFQLTKLNDITHRTQVRGLAEAIVNPLKAAPYSLLRGAVVVCDETNNTDAALAQRKFVLQVGVKFTPFSETILFTFINVAQATDVRESF